MPAAASADAAEVALGAPVARATANGVVQGTNGMTIVVECSALSIQPAASTRVSCTAGPASAQLTLPGPAAEAVGRGSGPLAPYTICVSATTHTILGGDIHSSGCLPSVGLSGAVLAADES
jgi:hypothetical protein